MQPRNGGGGGSEESSWLLLLSSSLLLSLLLLSLLLLLTRRMMVPSGRERKLKRVSTKSLVASRAIILLFCLSTNILRGIVGVFCSSSCCWEAMAHCRTKRLFNQLFTGEGVGFSNWES